MMLILSLVEGFSLLSTACHTNSLKELGEFFKASDKILKK